MKVLVLGSAGQIGRPLVNMMQKHGYEVRGRDIADGPYWDLRQPATLELAEDISWADFVFFLAFDVGGSTYLAERQGEFEFINNNVSIMKTVFEQLQAYGTPFLFSSSQMSLMNWSPYGVLKRVGEFYTRALDGMVVHFWNVYGPETDPDKFHVVTDFINMARQDHVIKMKTTGGERRQFLHVDDCSHALIALMDNYTRLERQDPWCVTSFQWVAIANLASVIAKAVEEETGKPVAIQRSSARDTVQLGADNTPNQAILDLWTPRMSLQEGIQAVLEETRSHG